MNATAVRISGPPVSEQLTHAVISATVVDLGNAFYQVTYVPEVSGTYALNVWVNQNFTHPDLGPTAGNDSSLEGHIEGSPFTLIVDDDDGFGETSTSFGPGRSAAIAGVEDHFQVQARDINGNNRTESDALLVRLDLRPGQEQSERGVVYYARVVYAGDGLYDVYYTAEWALYYDISVLVNGRHAFESPYELYVTPAPADAPATDTEYAINSTSIVNSDTYFTVFARDEFSNLRWFLGGEKYVVRVVGTITQHEVGLVTKGVVFDQNDGTYSVRYNVPYEGFHLIHVLHASDRKLPRGLLGEFFTNRWLFGEPRWTQVDSQTDFRFTTPDIPQLTRYAGVFHSARWSGYIEAPANGTYDFSAQADDGVRLFIDDVLVIDGIDGPPGNFSSVEQPVLLEGTLYSITLEYVQLTGPANVLLEWAWDGGLGLEVARHPIAVDWLYSGATHIKGSPFRMHASL